MAYFINIDILFSIYIININIRKCISQPLNLTNSNKTSHPKFTSQTKYSESKPTNVATIHQCSNFCHGIPMEFKDQTLRKRISSEILPNLTLIWFRKNHGSVKVSKAIWISILTRLKSINKSFKKSKIILKVDNLNKICSETQRLKLKLVMWKTKKQTMLKKVTYQKIIKNQYNRT